MQMPQPAREVVSPNSGVIITNNAYAAQQIEIDDGHISLRMARFPGLLDGLRPSCVCVVRGGGVFHQRSYQRSERRAEFLLRASQKIRRSGQTFAAAFLLSAERHAPQTNNRVGRVRPAAGNNRPINDSHCSAFRCRL